MGWLKIEDGLSFEVVFQEGPQKCICGRGRRNQDLVRFSFYREDLGYRIERQKVPVLIGEVVRRRVGNTLLGLSLPP